MALGTSPEHIEDEALVPGTALVERIVRLQTEFERQTIEHPGGENDPYIAAFSQAASRELLQGELGSIIVMFLTHRPDLEPSHSANLLLRGIQAPLIEMDDHYPNDRYKQPGTWVEKIHEIISDEERAAELTVNLLSRNVVSNKADRYKAFKLIAQLMDYDQSQPLRILDIGCSQNLGLKKLSLSEQFPFGAVEVVDVAADGTTRLLPNVTQHINGKLAASVPIGPSVGVDIIKPGPPEKKWAKSCSFYPKELNDGTKVQEYDALDEAVSPNVQFFDGDFADFDVERFECEFPDHDFDMVTFSTVLYQVSDEKRTAMLSLADRYRKKDSPIVIQDFVDIDTNDPRQLHFFSYWGPWTYSTILFEPTNTDRPFQVVFRWENGRCQRMQHLVGQSALRGTIADTVK